MKSESSEPAPASEALAEALGRLSDRLDKPFVTVNSVTGSAGIKRAYDEYDLLIRNASR